MLGVYTLLFVSIGKMSRLNWIVLKFKLSHPCNVTCLLSSDVPKKSNKTFNLLCVYCLFLNNQMLCWNTGKVFVLPPPPPPPSTSTVFAASRQRRETKPTSELNCGTTMNPYLQHTLYSLWSLKTPQLCLRTL